MKIRILILTALLCSTLQGYLQRVQGEITPVSVSFSNQANADNAIDREILTETVVRGSDSWFKATTWINYATSTHAHEILISDAGGWNFIHNSGGSVSVSVPLNTWTHQCQSWSTSSATLKVYYNGTLVWSYRVDNTSPLEEGGYILLGQYSGWSGSSDGSDVFGGQLMKLNIFGKELSGTEVAELYQGGRCSEVEKKFDNVRFITWESILSQYRTGNVIELLLTEAGARSHLGRPAQHLVEQERKQEVELVLTLLRLMEEAVVLDHLLRAKTATLTIVQRKLDGVKWTTSNNLAIVSGQDGYTFDEGGFDGSSQTTVLTVPGAQSMLDSTYNCVITFAEQDQEDMTLVVNSKTFTVSSEAKLVTTAVDQTLTCTIGELDVGGTPVNVVWKNPDGLTVSVSDTTNYLVSQGTVNSAGIQLAELTIKAAKLPAFVDQPTFTYKCSVSSSQYTESPASTAVDVVANILKMEVNAVNKEQLTGTIARISCTVTGLTEELSVTKWTTSEDVDVTSLEGYTVLPGSLEVDTQTTTLTIPADKNNNDATYWCVITSTEHGLTDQKTEVSSKVFTVTSTPKSITTAVDQTLTCNIGGLDNSGSPATVTWKDSAGQEVVRTDTTNYGWTQGTVDSSGNQAAELTIKTAKLDGFSSPSSVTYKCSVKSSQYTDSPASDYVDVVANILKLEVNAVNKEQLTGTIARISCTVTGLTEELGVTKWTTSEDVDVTSLEGYTVVPGSLEVDTQTTTLTIPADNNNNDATYWCVITSTEHGLTDQKTEVSSKVFTVTSTPKSITTAVDQTLTCNIGGLDNSGSPATVTWKDSAGQKVIRPDTTNYGWNQGTVDSSGNQAAELTIKTAKLDGFSSPSSVTYKCSVKSSQYTDSPASDYVEVVANILKLEVNAVNKEQLTGTIARISCTVTGLTEELGVTKWTTSEDVDVTSLEGYTVVPGSLEVDTQTTTLTIPADNNNNDATYWCVITSTEHGLADQKTEVSSKVFTVTSTPKSITTAVDQTLTCNIGGLDNSGSPATVTWKDSAGQEVIRTDTTNYGWNQGTVDSSGNQAAELTIKTAKLDGFSSPSSVTYKCSVKSSQYTDSPASDYVEVVANILKLEVNAVNKEQLTGTIARISCTVTGLTEELGVTKWTTSEDVDVTSLEGYTVVPGSLEVDTQTTTLTIPADKNNNDATYWCVIISTEHGLTDQKTEVSSKVFTVTSTPKSITTAVDQTLTCNIGGLDNSGSPATVTWKDSAGQEVVRPDTTNYGWNQGTVDSSGNQAAELTIKTAKLHGFSSPSSVTYKCSVKSSQYTDSPASDYVEVVANILKLEVNAVNKEQLTGTIARISCTVTGLTEELGVTKWTTSEDVDVTSLEGYTVVPGWLEVDTQTTTLTIPADNNNNDATYWCVITSTEHGLTDQKTEVSSKVFTVTSTPKSMTTAVYQTLTCNIGGLDNSGSPATVTWKDSAGQKVIRPDTTNYGWNQGTVDSSGNQAAELTIKTAKLHGFSSPSSVTYKCSVKSSQYTDSPASDYVEVVANILKLEVNAVNKEQLTGTIARISCTVTGLIEELGVTKWTTSEDVDVTSLEGYTVVPGLLEVDTQTTTLTIPADKNNNDATYWCVITSTEHGLTDQKTEVSSKVFTVTSTPKSITTAVDQTLTCNIGGLDNSGSPATVTWKDSAGQEVVRPDTTNYGWNQGTVDSSGNQAAELTIKTAKLHGFSSPSSVTYKCSVKSSQYTDSPASEYVDVVANILKLEVNAVNKEQLTGTIARISCTVTGLTEELGVTKWTTSEDIDVTSLEGYTVVPASLEVDTQTTTLTIPADKNNNDATYWCVITSTEHGLTDQKTEVSSKVFTVTSTPKSITTAVDQTLTCNIGELDVGGTPVNVVWKDPGGTPVSISDTTNYVVSQGTVDADGIQLAELNIKTAKLADFAAESSFTCRYGQHDTTIRYKGDDLLYCNWSDEGARLDSMDYF
ncbi:uncharacterized protein LOC134818085 [Bolinopsis microptera]|uniref:uncharacterized protein LOC134818085 n=1 Tax=Bolinopsis microptera TaxID=2820187 RepID=UPI0030796634